MKLTKPILVLLAMAALACLCSTDAVYAQETAGDGAEASVSGLIIPLDDNLMFAITVPLATVEESCCRAVPWGTVTVAVHSGRLLTTGVDPQHPSAFALDKVLGNEVPEAVLNAKVQLRTPAPMYATKKAKMNGGNSGICFRSHREPGSVDAHGYQFDVGGGLWGMLYDERGTRIVGMSQHSMPPGFDPGGWVDCRIRCVGPRIQYWLNGHKTLDYVEEDTLIPRKGNVGLQFHSWSAHPFEVQFKDIRIKELK